MTTGREKMIWGRENCKNGKEKKIQWSLRSCLGHQLHSCTSYRPQFHLMLETVPHQFEKRKFTTASIGWFWETLNVLDYVQSPLQCVLQECCHQELPETQAYYDTREECDCWDQRKVAVQNLTAWMGTVTEWRTAIWPGQRATCDNRQNKLQSGKTGP